MVRRIVAPSKTVSLANSIHCIPFDMFRVRSFLLFPFRTRTRRGTFESFANPTLFFIFRTELFLFRLAGGCFRFTKTILRYVGSASDVYFLRAVCVLLCYGCIWNDVSGRFAIA